MSQTAAGAGPGSAAAPGPARPHRGGQEGQKWSNHCGHTMAAWDRSSERCPRQPWWDRAEGKQRPPRC